MIVEVPALPAVTVTLVAARVKLPPLDPPPTVTSNVLVEVAKVASPE